MKRLITLSLLLCLYAAAFAQEKAAPAKKPDAKPAAAPSGMPPMPKPSPEMKKLIASVAGNYTSTMKSEPMFGMPATTSTGPARFTRGPGQLSLIETVKSVDEHGGKFSGHGLIWWDPKANVYKSIWCDNATPGGCMDAGNGKWDGDKLIFEGTAEMMGKNYTMRQTLSGFSAEGFTDVMEIGEGSGPLQKMFVVEYKKNAPAAKAPAAGQ